MNNTVLEYLEGYFGGELNESTSDKDIIDAFDELLETADAVRDFIGEGRWEDRARIRAAERRRKGLGPKKPWSQANSDRLDSDHKETQNDIRNAPSQGNNPRQLVNMNPVR